MRNRRVSGQVTVGGEVVYAGDLVESIHRDGSVSFTARRAHFTQLGAVGRIALDDGAAVRVFVGSTRVLVGYPQDPRGAAPGPG